MAPSTPPLAPPQPGPADAARRPIRTTGPDRAAVPPRAPWRRWPRAWAAFRFVAGLALALLALWVLSGHRSELSDFGSVLGHLRWWWLPGAALTEAASFVAFAGLQYRLLAVGGLSAPTRPLLGVTLASQAMNNSLPAGGVFAAVYGFRWYRRFGADDALAGWALVGTVVAAVVSLALVAAGGLGLATEEGASLDLIPVVVGVLVVTVAVGVLFVYERPLAVAVGWGLRASRRLTRRPRGDLMEHIDRIVQRVTVARLGWRDVAGALGWGLANWLLDAVCFAFSFLVIGAGVPYKGLLLAYGAGQLAANLPITPGGLGAVEGSITFALVAFGGARSSSLDAVLIYRLLSFWAELVVGWLCAGGLAMGVRRGRWPRRTLEAPVEVGPPSHPTGHFGPPIGGQP